jgi:hypothetical protein
MSGIAQQGEAVAEQTANELRHHNGARDEKRDE